MLLHVFNNLRVFLMFRPCLVSHLLGARPTNVTLVNVLDITSVFTCKNNFNSYVFDELPAGFYLRMFHIRQYVLLIRLVRNGSFLTPFVPTSQFIITISLYTICLQLMCASAVMTS